MATAVTAASLAVQGTAGAAVLCEKKETQVPAVDLGLVGPTGTNGTPGATGPTGSSHTYQVTEDDLGFDDTATVVATLELPAGKYLVTGRVWVTNSAGFYAECDLVASANGSATGTFTRDVMRVASCTNGRTPVVTTLVHEFTEPGVVKAHCLGETSSSGQAQRPTISATEVGAIN